MRLRWSISSKRKQLLMRSLTMTAMDPGILVKRARRTMRICLLCWSPARPAIARAARQLPCLALVAPGRETKATLVMVMAPRPWRRNFEFWSSCAPWSKSFQRYLIRMRARHVNGESRGFTRTTSSAPRWRISAFAWAGSVTVVWKRIRSGEPVAALGGVSGQGIPRKPCAEHSQHSFARQTHQTLHLHWITPSWSVWAQPTLCGTMATNRWSQCLQTPFSRPSSVCGSA
mmetsp:Transcript_51970/g.138530  ORF Transcript_51970/g.138530 Transcript_51970/m.138530 type:complete len:230 (+) Transcript_51970:165-854(+)